MKKEKQKTAVELFAQRLIQRGIGYNKMDFEEALQEEKEQIINAYKAAEDKSDFFEYEHRYGREYLTAEPYYNETFKQQEQ